MHFAPWEPARGHAGLSKEEMAERCALTTEEQLTKLTTSPEYLAWEEALHFNAAKPARSWLSWLPLRSLRATIVALLLFTFVVSQSALLGIGQPPAFWLSTHHTGNETPSSLPAGLYSAAHGTHESAAAAVSSSQLGNMGEEDTPRANYLGQEPNMADTEQDSASPSIESQTQANNGQESEVAALSLATDEQERLSKDHASQDTNNSHIPGTEVLAATQQLPPFSASEALWGLWGMTALLKLRTALSRAVRMRGVTKKRAVSPKESLASKHTRTPPAKRGRPLPAAQKKSPNVSRAHNSSNKENVPEHSQHRNTTILAAKGATNSDLAEIADLRRQLDEASHVASFWEGSYRTATGALQDKRKNLKTKVARAAQEINSLQEKIQDRESRLKKVVLDCQLHDNSETIKAQQLQETVKKLESDVQVLVAERDALRTQNTALQALWETAQQATAPAPQPSPPMLHEHEGASAALGDGAASNEMEESDDCSTATEDIDEGEPLSSVYERRRARRQRRELKQRSMRSS